MLGGLHFGALCGEGGESGPVGAPSLTRHRRGGGEVEGGGGGDRGWEGGGGLVERVEGGGGEGEARVEGVVEEVGGEGEHGQGVVAEWAGEGVFVTFSDLVRKSIVN